MHQQGVSSPQAREVMGEISRGIQNFLKTVKDTLLIVSADHGQVDVAGYVDLYGDEKLMGMLKTYPFQEARAPAFLVKPQCRRDFQLFPSEHLIEQGGSEKGVDDRKCYKLEQCGGSEICTGFSLRCF